MGGFRFRWQRENPPWLEPWTEGAQKFGSPTSQLTHCSNPEVENANSHPDTTPPPSFPPANPFPPPFHPSRCDCMFQQRREPELGVLMNTTTHTYHYMARDHYQHSFQLTCAESVYRTHVAFVSGLLHRKEQLEPAAQSSGTRLAHWSPVSAQA